MRTYERDVEVEVPPEVFTLAAMIEAHRFGMKRTMNARHTRDLVTDRWLTNYLQAVGAVVGEWAVCKVTNSHWSGLDGPGARDTTAGEVKWSFHPRYGLLIAGADVKPDEDYWLVVGEPPSVRVVGVLKGRDVHVVGRQLTDNGRPPAVVVCQSNIPGWVTK